MAKLPSVGSYSQSSCLASQSSGTTGELGQPTSLPALTEKVSVCLKGLQTKAVCTQCLPRVDKGPPPTGGAPQSEGVTPGRAFDARSQKACFEVAEAAGSHVPVIPRRLKVHIAHTELCILVLLSHEIEEGSNMKMRFLKGKF